MTTPTYDGAGSLFALGMRLTRLNTDGSPMTGADNSYITDALIQAETGLEYEDGEQITQRNGAGVVCLTYRAPDSLLRGTLSSLQVCTPDPAVLQFLQGGRVLYDDTNTPIGYQAPAVGEDPNPNGIGLELFTRAIIDGAYSGFFWWLMPRASLRTSGGMTMSGTDPLLPEFEGNLTQNPNWGDGPTNDWVYPSERVWQYVQVDALPFDMQPARFLDVEAELTTSSVAVTPATDSIAVGETAQLRAEATMSDASTRDVTQLAAWSSADATVVSVDQEGVITGEAAGGPFDVTATYGGQSGASSVTVTA